MALDDILVPTVFTMQCLPVSFQNRIEIMQKWFHRSKCARCICDNIRRRDLFVIQAMSHHDLFQFEQFDFGMILRIALGRGCQFLAVQRTQVFYEFF